jgi:hypothetical protein
MQGRRWEPKQKVWIVPLTKVTVRFVHKYLEHVAHWTFRPAEDIPERLEKPQQPKIYSRNANGSSFMKVRGRRIAARSFRQRSGISYNSILRFTGLWNGYLKGSMVGSITLLHMAPFWRYRAG